MEKPVKLAVNAVTKVIPAAEEEVRSRSGKNKGRQPGRDERGHASVWLSSAGLEALKMPRLADCFFYE